MNNLEQLINDKYPDSEISHIERRAFEQGWNAREQAIRELRDRLADGDLLEAQYNHNWDHSDFHTIK